ncbi:carboxypeptidase-like regulatory domain-containing protein [Candidatus Bathyarchaeota archaeon]|nr:carboxypeptidase-like regulatory domain-containing protein [Candidatus Bathyarchaeota archaeon]
MTTRYKRTIVNGPLPSASLARGPVVGSGGWSLARDSMASPNGQDSWRWACSVGGFIPTPGMVNGSIYYPLDISGIQNAWKILLRSVTLYARNNAPSPLSRIVGENSVTVRSKNDPGDNSGIIFDLQPPVSGGDFTFQSYGSENTPILDLTGKPQWWIFFGASCSEGTPFYETDHRKSGPTITVDVYPLVHLFVRCHDQYGAEVKSFTAELYEDDKMTLIGSYDDGGTGLVDITLEAGRYFVKCKKGSDESSNVEVQCVDDQTSINVYLPIGIPPGTKVSFSAFVKSDGQPVSGALVILSSGGSQAYSKSTGTTGQTSIDKLPTGTYQLTCSKEGYDAFSKNVSLLADTVDLPITLTAKTPIPTIDPIVVVAGIGGLSILAILTYYFMTRKRKRT